MSQTTVDTAVEGSTRNGEREHPPERQGAECPECSGSIRHDAEHGERTCTECGLVLDADAIDYGPEWLCLDDEEDRRRVGPPVSSIKHDRGLSTTIGWRDEDAYGNRVSERKRERLRRLRTWNERYSSKNAQERNLKQAFGEIERMASALGLPKPCRETAGVLYRRAVDEDLLPGRSIEAMATACLYAAARQHGTPRTLVAFESVSRVEKLPVQRAYRYLSSELGLRIEPADPIHYLPQYASALEVSDDAERLAREILEAAKAHDLHSGRSPAGLAAAAIYGAARLTNERVTQATVGEETGVSSVTVRNRYRELLDAYEESRDHR
ncbi:transcription initiation factor IIB [Natrinema gari]|uniref:Transcription initiation factor IIB n=1 Tax=Natrinema gari JCM 14663 TaxID=1230459 RepID=L9ZBS0_9EURY|nr:TFIIB-type zinc ribbon-containing protein [Natrinema gari]ELY83925.1 Transcription factor TFIIB cyclin-related protein [Natrinema gari JCM 14663]